MQQGPPLGRHRDYGNTTWHVALEPPPLLRTTTMEQPTRVMDGGGGGGGGNEPRARDYNNTELFGSSGSEDDMAVDVELAHRAPGVASPAAHGEHELLPCAPLNFGASSLFATPVPDVDVLRGGWISWPLPLPSHRHVGVEMFCTWYTPSRLARVYAATGCQWVSVQGSGTEAHGANDWVAIDRLKAQGEKALARRAAELKVGAAGGTESVVQDILSIAQAVGYTVGKWLVYVPAVAIDATWRKIAAATAAGELGASAKVSAQPPREGSDIVICVYISDFNDVARLQRTRQRYRQRWRHCLLRRYTVLCAMP